MKLRSVTLAVTLALGLLAAPLPAEAQQAGKVYRIGWLGESNEVDESDFTSAFEVTLGELGWVRRKTFAMEYRWARREYDRLPNLAADLVKDNVDVIVAASTRATRAAMNATKTIPIVFTRVGDPVASGLVVSLGQPTGNATGVSSMVPDVAGKQLELLKEVIPGLSRVAVLLNPTDPEAALMLQQLHRAAKVLDLTLQPAEMRSLDDLGPAFVTMSRARPDGLIVIEDPVMITGRMQGMYVVALLALKHRLPTMSTSSGLTMAGGLMSYAPNYVLMFERAAVYVDKILKGAKAGHLPVERPMTFSFEINLKTAKALDVTIPPAVLMRADWTYR